MGKKRRRRRRWPTERWSREEEGVGAGSGWMAAIKRFHPFPLSPAAPIYKGE